jgi:putative membrane protein
MIESLPAVNAGLNATAFVLLSLGVAAIKRKRIALHKGLMISAFAVSAAFLACYLVYHYHVGSKKFPGEGVWKAIYLLVLAPHIVLAIAMLPMIALTLIQAFRGRFAEHRAIARWTAPIWLYVSITGVIVYVMLYRMNFGPPGR